MDLRPAPHPQQPTDSAAASSWGRALALAALVGCLTAAGTWWLVMRAHGADSASTEHLRAVASRLRAAGALGEAARMYEAALQDAHLSREERGTQSYALGLLYLEEHRYEQALRWLYEADALGGGGDEVGAKIVHTLERLGRTNAAQNALEEQTRLSSKGHGKERASDDPVVAEVGETHIVRSQVIRALDDLPQEMAKSFKSSKGRGEFLRKYVADELLWRKAKRLEMDRDPDVQRHVTQAERQLAVAKMLEKNILDKTDISPSEVKNYFEAHAEQFKKTSLAGAKPQIEQILRLQKTQDVVADWVQKESTDSGVKLFAERMGSQP